MEKIKQIVEEIFNKLETNDEGEVATYAFLINQLLPIQCGKL